MKSNGVTWHYKLGLSLLVALILVSCFSRQLSGNSWDFLNHYRSAGLMLEGLSPYSNPHFQSLPLVALPFTAFHLFSFETARWIYAGMHALAAILIPYLVFKALQSQSRKQGSALNSAQLEKYCTGVFVAFIASFRFLDNEFFVSQVSLWVMLGLLLSFFSLKELQRTELKAGEIAENQRSVKIYLLLFTFSVLLTMATSFKILSLLCLLSFAKHLKIKQLFVLGGVFLFLNVFIYPSHFLEWAAAFTQRLASAEVYQQSLSQQGLFPLIYKFTSSKTIAFNLATLVLFVLGGLSLIAFKNSYRQAKLQASTPIDQTLILEVGFWMLLAYLTSPFPWQYSFSILWMLIPVTWFLGNRKDRRILLACSLVLGLTPKGIIGANMASKIEGHQLIAFLLLLIMLVAGNIFRRHSMKQSS